MRTTVKFNGADMFIIALLAGSGYLWYHSVTQVEFISMMYRVIFTALLIAIILRRLRGRSGLI